MFPDYGVAAEIIRAGTLQTGQCEVLLGCAVECHEGELPALA